jgi:hypothetical protein
MRIRRELGALLAGILTTVLMTAVVEFGRRSALSRRPPPEESADRPAAAGGTTEATRDLLNPRLHFRWL